MKIHDVIRLIEEDGGIEFLRKAVIANTSIQLSEAAVLLLAILAIIWGQILLPVFLGKPNYQNRQRNRRSY